MNGRHWVIGEVARLVFKVVVAAMLLVLLAYACSAQELTAEVAREHTSERVRVGTTAMVLWVAWCVFSIGVWVEVGAWRRGREDRWQ